MNIKENKRKFKQRTALLLVLFLKTLIGRL